MTAQGWCLGIFMIEGQTWSYVWWRQAHWARSQRTHWVRGAVWTLFSNGKHNGTFSECSKVQHGSYANDIIMLMSSANTSDVKWSVRGPFALMHHFTSSRGFLLLWSRDRVCWRWKLICSPVHNLCSLVVVWVCLPLCCEGGGMLTIDVW